MKAMILCAGEGTRLGELTKTTPKALLPVGPEPIVDRILRWLASFGIVDYVINLHHLGQQIQDHLENRPNLEYIHEPELLGTAGSIKNAGALLGDSFVVIFGDILTNFDLSVMLEAHKQHGALVSIAIAHGLDNRDHGVVQLDDSDRILDFKEKPSNMVDGFYCAGTFVMEKAVLEHIPAGVSDLGFDVLPKLVKSPDILVYGFKLDALDYVIDIGTPDEYQRIQKLYARHSGDRGKDA